MAVFEPTSLLQITLVPSQPNVVLEYSFINPSTPYPLAQNILITAPNATGTPIPWKIFMPDATYAPEPLNILISGTNSTADQITICDFAGNVIGIVDSNLEGILPVKDGGTGDSQFMTGSVLLGRGQLALGQAAPNTDGYVLTDNGPGHAPAFKALAVPTFPLSVLNGGTGLNNISAGNVIVGSDDITNTYVQIPPEATGTVLTSTGTASLPTFQTPAPPIAPLNLTQSSVNPTLVVANNGTSLTSGGGINVVNNSNIPAGSFQNQGSGAAVNAVNSNGPTLVNGNAINAQNTMNGINISTTSPTIKAANLGTGTALYASGGTNGAIYATSSGATAIETPQGIKANSLTLTTDLSTANGGTGLSGYVQGAVLLGNATGTSLAVAPPVAVGRVLTDNGIGNNPTFQAAPTGGGGFSNMLMVTDPEYIWTDFPAAGSSFKVTCVGGGGGGTGTNGFNVIPGSSIAMTNGGYGGGGGGTIVAYLTVPVGLAHYSITIGGPGAGGSAANNGYGAGTNGGNTSVATVIGSATTTIITVTGGAGAPTSGPFGGIGGGGVGTIMPASNAFEVLGTAGQAGITNFLSLPEGGYAIAFSGLSGSGGGTYLSPGAISTATPASSSFSPGVNGTAYTGGGGSSTVWTYASGRSATGGAVGGSGASGCVIIEY